MEKINAEEMSYLLKMVSVATRRTFNADEGSIWLHLLSEYTYDECHEAFTSYLKESDEYLTPHTISKIIRKKRRARIAQSELPEPPNGVNAREYLDWLDETLEEVSRPPSAPAAPKQITSMSPETKRLSS